MFKITTDIDNASGSGDSYDGREGVMIGKNCMQFLTQIILNNYAVDQQIQRLAYSERVTVALDLQILIKQLVKEIENKTGEDLIAIMFEQE